MANQASYDIMVIPRDLKKLDTVEFCQLLAISKEEFIKKIETTQFPLARPVEAGRPGRSWR